MHSIKLFIAPQSAHGSRLRRGRTLLALLFLLGSFAGTSGPAASRQARYQYQFPFQYQYHHRYRHHVERESDDKAVIKKLPEGPMFAVVSIAGQHVSFYDANGLWARGQVSTGVSGHPTPTGVFTILEKERWHRSNIYSGAPMPFMQRVTWTGVAMHAGVVPGHPASHGCIRLHPDFAKQLFAVTSAGQRVVIAPDEVTPADIVHPHLPVPKLQAAPPAAAGEPKTSDLNRAVEQVALDAKAMPQKAATRRDFVNPIEFARALKADAAAKAAGAVQARKSALAVLESKSAEARASAKDLAEAELALRRVQGELEEASRAAAKAQGEEAIGKAAERKSSVESRLAGAEDKLAQVRAIKAGIDGEVLAAGQAIRDADAAAAAAAEAAKEATRRLEPVSIFISRKTGRLYVRQATQHLFDIPIAIRDPDRAIGTHLFIATRAQDDGASLRWAVLTPPAAVEVKVKPHSSRRGRRIQPDEEAAPVPPFPETASGALDRIEIPEEAAQRVSELLWTGATVLISDVGMSGEGRYAMDFMILERTRIREW